MNEFYAGRKSSKTSTDETMALNATNNFKMVTANQASNRGGATRTASEELFHYSRSDSSDESSDDEAVEASKQATLEARQNAQRMFFGVQAATPRPATGQSPSGESSPPRSLSPAPPGDSESEEDVPSLVIPNAAAAAAAGGATSTDQQIGTSLGAATAVGSGLVGGVALNPATLQLLQTQLQQLQPQAALAPELLQALALGMAMAAGTNALVQQVHANPTAPIEQAGIPTLAECKACRQDRGVIKAITDAKWELFHNGNIHADDGTGWNAVVAKLDRSSKYATKDLHVLQHTWNHREAKISLWKLLKQRMTALMCPRRGAAVKAWLLSMRIPVPMADLPVKKANTAATAEMISIIAQYAAVDAAIQPLAVLIDSDLHRAKINGASKEPIGNLAFYNAIIAFLQSPDKEDMIKFCVDNEDASLLGKYEVAELPTDEVVEVSHLQLGSVSQAIKSVLRNGYSEFRRPTKGIGVSKVPEIVAEAEKIWGELKVSA